MKRKTYFLKRETYVLKREMYILKRIICFETRNVYFGTLNVESILKPQAPILNANSSMYLLITGCGTAHGPSIGTG